jgi:hypothetical protein
LVSALTPGRAVIASLIVTAGLALALATGNTWTLLTLPYAGIVLLRTPELIALHLALPLLLAGVLYDSPLAFLPGLSGQIVLLAGVCMFVAKATKGSAAILWLLGLCGTALIAAIGNGISIVGSTAAGPWLAVVAGAGLAPLLHKVRTLPFVLLIAVLAVAGILQAADVLAVLDPTAGEAAITSYQGAIRVNSTLRSTQDFALVAVVGLLVALHGARDGSGVPKTLSIVCSGLIAVALLLTLTRAAWVAVLSALVVQVVVPAARRRGRSSAGMLLALLMALGGGYVALSVNDSLGSRFEATGTSGDVSAVTKLTSQWPTAVAVVRHHPMGSGTAGLRVVAFSTVDNSYLTAAVVGGLLSGILFVVLVLLPSLRLAGTRSTLSVALLTAVAVYAAFLDVQNFGLLTLATGLIVGMAWLEAFVSSSCPPSGGPAPGRVVAHPDSRTD